MCGMFDECSRARQRWHHLHAKPRNRRIGDRAGRPSAQERQPEIDLRVSTDSSVTPSRIVGRLAESEWVDAQSGPLSCLPDRDTAHR